MGCWARARDEHALALAAGEPVEGAVGQVGGVDRVECGVDDLAVFGAVTGEEPFVWEEAEDREAAKLLAWQAADRPPVCPRRCTGQPGRTPRL